MNSQSSVADQSIDEHAEEKEVGDLSKCVDGEEIILQPKEDAGKVEADNSKEEGLTGMASTVRVSEAKPGFGDVSVADVTKEDEEHENVAEVENSLQESEVSNSSGPAVETNEGSLQRQTDDAREMPSEVQEISSDFVETSASQAPVISESKTEAKQDESPLVSTGVDISEDGNGEAETLGADYPESSKDKADIELIKPEDSKDEIQASEVAEENDIDSGHPASIEVPIKILEVESGSPEEQKSKELSSNVSTIDGGGEIVGSSSHEVKPSEASEAVDRNDNGLEVETVQASVKIQEDVKAKAILAETESDDNVSQGIEVKKDDEIVEGGIEMSTVPDDVPPLAKVSYEEEKASARGEMVGKGKESSLESDGVDTAPKVAEVSLEGGNGWQGEKLLGKEKVVNAEAVERDLVDTISSVQVKAPATTEVESEPLEVTSKELNIAPEASEVFSEGDKISAGDEKSERLKGEEATSVEAPTDITNAEEPLDQVIEEEKTESSVSETQVPSEDKLVNKEEDINEEAREITLQTPSTVQNDFAKKSMSQEPVNSESKTEDLNCTEIRPTSENGRKQEEAPLVSTGVGISEAGNIEAEKHEAASTVFSKDKVGIELIKSEDSNDEIQVLVSVETPSVVVPDASEAPEENDIDLSNLTSIEVPLKDLEVESGSPEEEKSNESTETKEPSSNVTAINAGGEVVGSSFNEAEPSGVAEVIEKKNDSLEVETIQTSVEIHEDLEAKPELAQTQSDENVSEGIKVENDDEVVEPGVEISTVPDDIPPLAKVSYDEEKASEPGVAVKEEASLEGNYIVAVPKVAKVSFEGENIMEGDTLVDKETVVNAKAVERDLVGTITDTTEAEVCSVQVKSPTTTEIANETLEVTSKKLNIAPEASVVFFEGDKISEGDEKSESLKGEEATSLEAPTDITAAEEPLDQVIEDNKIESSESETKVPSEDKLVHKEKDVNEEAKEINLQNQADGAHEIPSVVQSDIAEKSTSQEPAFSESKTEDLKDTEIKPTSENDRKPEEAPLFSTGAGISKDGNVEDERQEASNPGFLEDRIDNKLIMSENATDEIQVFVPAETPTAVVPDASEAPERNDIDSSNLTSIEVPVKDLEVESGSPEEQKSNESTETKEPSSNVGAINDGGEVVGSSSYEMKHSGVAEVIEKKNESLEVETVQTSVKIQDHLEAKPELAQTHSDEYISEIAEVKKDDGIVEGGIEISSVPDDIPPLAEVSYEEEKTSKPGVVVGVEEETSLKGDDIDTMPNVAEASFEGGNVSERDKLVDKEKVVDAEAVEKDLVDTITDPEEVEVTCVQVKSTGTEIVNEPPEVASKELNIAPEASEVPSDADKLYASDEKIESLKGEAATSVVVPNDITTAEESVDQVIEEKNERLLSETQASSEYKLVDEEKDVNEEAMEINLPSQAEGADETPSVVQSDFAKTSTFHEPVFSESKNEDLKDTEIKPTFENGRKQEEAPLVSTGEDISEDEKAVAETQEVANPEDRVDIELIIEGGIETSAVPADVPLLAEVSSEEEKASEPGVLVDEGGISLESDNVDTTPKVAEVSLEGGNSWEGNKLVVKEKVLNGEAVERDLIGTFTDPTKAEVSSDQLKAPVTIEIINEPLEVTSKELNIAHEACEIPAEVDKVSVGDEEKIESLIVGEASSVEVPNDLLTIKESLDQLCEEKKGGESEMTASTEDELVDKEKNVNVEGEESDLINTSTDAIAAEVSYEQVKAPEIVEEETYKQALEETSKELKIVPEVSEVPSEDDKLSAGEEKSETFKGETATLVEAPKVMTTIIESLDQVIENKKIVSSISEKEAPPEDKLVDNGKNVNEVAEVSDLVDTSIEPTGAEVSSNHVEAYETAEIIKAESNKQASEVISNELNIASEANHIPSEGDEVSAGDEEKRESLKDEDATLEDAAKDITISEESPNQLIKQEKQEGSKSEMEALAEDKLVEKEKDVNAEADKRNLVDTSTDISAAVKVSETAAIVNESDKEALELASNELSIFPEAGQVPSEGEKASSSEAEKSESLKGENVASLEATKDITIVENSMDQLIDENKSESSKNEMEAPIEMNREFDTSNLFPEAAKDIIASEAAEEKQDETSNDLIMAEKKDNESADKEEEVKVDSVLQNATDKPEQEELGAKKEESEKSKDQDPIVSSDSGDAKLSKEVSKRESNIFSKVKRTIVKAKKAILRKSPGPKSASSEAKH